MSSRSAIENIVRLWWPAATATSRRSNSRLARRIRSSWPSVIGSKVPGYTAVSRVAVVTSVSTRRGDGRPSRPPLALDAAQCSRALQPGAALRSSSKWTAPARPARHGSSPAAAIAGRIDRRRSLGVDEAAGDDDPRRGGERRRQQRRVERRIEEDDVERARRRARHPLQRVGPLDPHRLGAAGAAGSPSGWRPAPDRARAGRPRPRRATPPRSRARPSRRRRRRSASRRASGRAS